MSRAPDPNPTNRPGAVIRPFDPARGDAAGILAVDRATFNDCPYNAAQVQRLLADGRLHAWVADLGGEVAGFVVAFATHAARGPGWEIDLLAVQPNYQGQGLATALIRTASAHPPEGTHFQRAVVATANAASAKAFRRAGFEPDLDACHLLLYIVRGRHRRPAAPQGSEPTVEVRRQALAGLDSWELVAEAEGRRVGQAELLPVQTLLYKGAWIESFSAATAAARSDLVHTIVESAKAADWDEVGCLVPARNAAQADGGWPLRHALLAGGFRDGGEYRILHRRPEPAL